MIFPFLNILFASLALGGAFVVRRYLNPRSLEDSFEHYLNFHQQILSPIDRYLLVLSILAAAMTAGQLANHHIWVYLPTKLLLEGVIFGLIGAAIFLGVLIPIDQQISVWRAEEPPVAWRHQRALWLRWHALQTIFSFLAFSFYVIAALIAHSLQN